MKTKIMMMLFAVMTLTACDLTDASAKPKSTDRIIQEKQARVMREAQRQTGLPSIKNFQEKKMLKMLYELRDQENLVCHAYLCNEMEGKVGQYIGRCIGYGLPASTQYSNPEKIAHSDQNYHSSRNWVKLPQAEPNGLFMPEGLSATWLMMLDSDGTARPVYIEPKIIVSPIPLHK